MRRRGDAWELRVYLGADPVTGKQRYASRTVRGGKREAQRILNEMVTEVPRSVLERAARSTAVCPPGAGRSRYGRFAHRARYRASENAPLGPFDRAGYALLRA